MISIIIRTKNEERWIRPCLDSIRRQRINEPVEVVLVDNASTDKTVERARNIWPELRLVELEEFLPGHAINEGLRASKGEYLVCLSAHCPPVDDLWLAALLRNFEDPSVAGVYGRQVPTRFTNPIDKRDLLLTFGLDRRVQERDTFFHNANSMFRRDVWELYPFDESISNIEDRLWGKTVIDAGYRIVYEPDAAVFHHHGIHQNNRSDRAANVIRILEDNIPDLHPERYGDPFDPDSLEVAVVIPLREDPSGIDLSEHLVARTIEAAQSARYVNRILVTTESQTLAELARRLGAEVPVLRSSELAQQDVRVDEVLREYMLALEADGYLPDIVVPLEITYPFRPPGLIDGVIDRLISEGTDTVIAGIPEYRACWRREGSAIAGISYSSLTDLSVPRSRREPIHIGIPSLACATYPANLRAGSRRAGRLGIYEINDPLAGIEIRTLEDLHALESRMSWESVSRS